MPARPRTQDSSYRYSEPQQATSDQADFLEFRFDDFLVEGLHDVLVGAGVKRTGDVNDIVLGGAEDHLRPIAAWESAQRLEKLVAVHHRHVPIEQYGVRQLALAMLQRLLAVLRFGDVEGEPLQDAASHLADDARIVDHQTRLHEGSISLAVFRLRMVRVGEGFMLRWVRPPNRAPGPR